MTRPVALHTFKSKLLALMVLRVILAVVFLGITGYFHLKQGSLIQLAYFPLYFIVVTISIITVVYAVLLKYVKNLKLFAYVQVTVDLVLITAMVYVTGGIESILPIIYYISIVGSALLLEKRGGYYAAILSSIFYGVLMDLDYYRILPQKYKVFYSFYDSSWDFLLTIVATNVFCFFTVAYLMGQYSARAMRVERELEEKEIDYDRLENLNRLIVDNIPTGIMTLDRQRRITSFNKAATDITGYSLREVYYRSLDDIFPQIIGESGLPLREGMRIERVVSRSDGEEICLGFTLSSGEEGDISSIVIFQDLTKLKVLEEQLRRDDKLRALGELSASIAHEIRNPLASISGSIQFLGQELELGAEQGRLMEIILRESKRLDSLITDFLLFAKPASKGMPDRINVTGLIEETIQVFRNSPQASGIKIESTPGSGTVIDIDGDKRQISQVFWNLFLNSASAMGGSGTLTVSANVMEIDDPAIERPSPAPEHDLEQNVNYVEILVSDTGAGIDRSDLLKIFDPFYSTRGEGTGMGLALVHRIIESHGGTINVTSEPGEGTSFQILLPLCKQLTTH